MSGFEPDLADTLGSAFREQGFLPTGAGAVGGRPGEQPFEGPLKPGDAVGVVLVNGDLQLGATGTVTHVDDDRVYAFGHPLYNLGPTAFPMTRAYVYTVLPSLASSMKLSTPGEVIRAFLRDRAVAIAGRLGPGPKMIPSRCHSGRIAPRSGPFISSWRTTRCYAADGGRRHLEYARLLRAAVARPRSMSGVRKGDRGTRRGLRQRLLGRPAIDQRVDIHRGANRGPARQRLREDQHQSIDRRSDRAKRLKPPRSSAYGSTTSVRGWAHRAAQVLLRTRRGENCCEPCPSDPSNASGTLSLLVADGNRLGQIEQREARSPQPRNVAQMIRMLNRAAAGARFISSSSARSGAVVSGETLTALPLRSSACSRRTGAPGASAHSAMRRSVNEAAR